MNHPHTALAAAPGWKTSTRTSQGANCVEITTTIPGWIGIRDTKNRSAGLLALNHHQWTAFLHAIRTDELN